MAESGSASIKPADVRIDDDVCDMEEEEVIFTPETLEVIEEAERLARDPNAKRYTDIDELIKVLFVYWNIIKSLLIVCIC